jgi:hypothetical protein
MYLINVCSEIAKTNIKVIPSGVITELEELLGVALIEG